MFFRKGQGAPMIDGHQRGSINSARTPRIAAQAVLAALLLLAGSNAQAAVPSSTSVHEMTEDKFDKLGPMFGDIGAEAAAIVGGDPDGLYIYVEVGQGWVESCVFKDDGKVVRFYPSSANLNDLILEAWEAEDPEKRWAVMEYEVNGTTFDAAFQFPEKVDVGRFDIKRRQDALERRYGNKPIIYPPLPSRSK